jgi:hypothetical protein
MNYFPLILNVYETMQKIVFMVFTQRNDKLSGREIYYYNTSTFTYIKITNTSFSISYVLHF